MANERGTEKRDVMVREIDGNKGIQAVVWFTDLSVAQSTLRVVESARGQNKVVK